MGPAYETWRKKANNRIVGGQMARAGPLGGEDLPTSAATPSALYLPPEQHAALPASVAVTAVTDLLFGYPIIFGRRVTEEAPGENAQRSPRPAVP